MDLARRVAPRVGGPRILPGQQPLAVEPPVLHQQLHGEGRRRAKKDLSLKKQLLDVMPEGLEELAAHNLITFKSHHEALNDWALKELTGHYVNYRKQVSPSFQQPVTLQHAIYFSGTTFSTVGYGDFVPAPHAQLLALTEAALELSGQLPSEAPT